MIAKRRPKLQAATPAAKPVMNRPKAILRRPWLIDAITKLEAELPLS